jgi:DNA-binding MurR/RpiR family transcriptional regulator
MILKNSTQAMTDSSQLSIHAHIRNSMDRLSVSERRLAKVLLANYPIAGLETVVQLAARAQVSGATVVRFMRQLAFESYPAFQQQLREEVQKSASSPLQLYEVRTGSPGENRIEEALSIYEMGLRRTFSRTSATDIQSAAELLADGRKRILCTGGRFSGFLANYLQAHLHQICPSARYLPPSSERVDQLINIDRRDVLVVFDFRRYQADTLRFAKACRQRGATLLLITDPWLSPIAEVSQQILMCDVEASSPYDSLVPAVAIVETLIAAVVEQLGEPARERVEKLEAARDEVIGEGRAK